MIIVNGFPKTGTGIMLKALAHCGLKVVDGVLLRKAVSEQVRFIAVQGAFQGEEIDLDWTLGDNYVVHAHCCMPNEEMLKHRVINCVRHPRNVLLSGARWALASKQAEGNIEGLLLNLIEHGTYLNLQPSWLDGMALHYSAGGLGSPEDLVLFKFFEEMIVRPPGLPVTWVQAVADSGCNMSWPPPWDQITSKAVVPKHGIVSTNSGAHSDWKENKHWTLQVELAYRACGGLDVERMMGYGSDG